MKKRILVLILVSMAICLAGCGSSAKGPAAETRTFTDSLGRTVEIPEHVSKVAVSGPLAEIVVYGFAPELMVGWCSRWSEEAAQYIPGEYLSLPTLGQLHGGKGELNLEEILAVAPDVVIDIGDSKGDLKEDLDALSEQTGIPFVHINATTETTGEMFRILGELTGLTDRAEEYAAYCDSVYERTRNIMNDVGDNKVKALYCLGDAGCNVIAQNSYHGEVVDLITDNLAILDDPSSKGTGNEVDMEQILVWNPDFIIFAPDSIYDSVSSDPTWQEVNAIKNGNYVKVPFGPYNWMGFPPSIQHYLGMMWLTTVLYPEECDFDLKSEVVKYYKMFYHCELTDEQYDSLMEGALVK